MDYKKFLKLSFDFLMKNKPKEMTSEELYRYLQGRNQEDITLRDVLKQLCITSQNYRGFKNYIGYFTRNTETIEKALFNFDIRRSLEEYKSSEELYQGFIKAGCSMRKSQHSWKLYSKRIYNGMIWLSDFDTMENFIEFMGLYDGMEIEFVHSISKGKDRFLPFTLACDFIKELGFKHYSKPDVYILKTMNLLECLEKEQSLNIPFLNEYSAFFKMKEIAEENEVTEYFIDKMIWTICSGEFEGTNYPKNKLENQYYELLINNM